MKGLRGVPLPREHGAWAMLAGGVLLALAHPWARTPAALVLAALFLLGFALQAPLRALASGHPAGARIWTAVYALPMLAGAAFLWMRHDAVWLLPAALFGGGLTLAELWARRRKRQRHAVLRLLGAAGLTAVLPGMLALFHPDRLAYALVLWVLVVMWFASRVPWVRANQTARSREGDVGVWRRPVLAGQAALWLVVLALAGARLAAPWVVIALVPGTAGVLAPAPGLSNPEIGKREILQLSWFVGWLIASYHLGGFDALVA